MSEVRKQKFIISLGSNTRAMEYIPYALTELRKVLNIARETGLMRTKPVDFPYPSGDFINVILWGETDLNREEMYDFLHHLEEVAGRERNTPALVPLDADLLVWGDEVLKPKDLERPYMQGLI